MFISRVEVVTCVGIRFGYVVDIIVRADVSKVESEETRRIVQSCMISKLLELEMLSQKFGTTHFPGEPVKVPIECGEISATTTVMFRNSNEMKGFIKEVNGIDQA